MCKPSEEKNMQKKSSVKGEKQTAEELNLIYEKQKPPQGKKPYI